MVIGKVDIYGEDALFPWRLLQGQYMSVPGDKHLLQGQRSCPSTQPHGI